MQSKTRKERFFLALTLLRIVLAFVVGILIIAGRNRIALFFFVATASIAFFESVTSKRMIEKSLLRSVFDFFADRLLINVAAITLAVKALLPIWAMLIILLRDLLTAIIAFIMFWRDSRREFKPTALGRISLFFQIIALMTVIMDRLDWGLVYIAVVITILSGIESLFKSEFRLVKRKTDFDDFKILRLIKFADFFTLTNVLFGIISILFSISGRFDTAAIMLMLAVISDFFDGKVAKLMGQQNEFGKELDSLADTISFGVAPAIFGFSMIQTPLALIAFTVFLSCGILRLARYNIMSAKDSFTGMPITLNGIIIPLTYLLRIPLGKYLNFHINHLPYVYIILGILMVSSIKIRRIS